MTQNLYTVRLPNRGLIRVEGADRHEFLQGLITNDIRKLAPGKLLYACLLNAQGKFLHDFFIAEAGNALLLDCEGGARAQDLMQRLSMYKLRRNVTMSAEEKNEVYAAAGHENLPSGYPDPRHPALGWRSFQKPENLPERPFADWDRLRISLCIPDGSRDLAPGSSTMDEARMDQLNAIDYDKGCYVGQELTARMHYRGLGKKHLCAVHIGDYGLTEFPPPFTEIRQDGELIGEMRSRCGDIGLALLKDEVALNQMGSGE